MENYSNIKKEIELFWVQLFQKESDFTFKGQIINASTEGAQKFYDAITMGVQDSMRQIRDYYAGMLTPDQKQAIDLLLAEGPADQAAFNAAIN